MGVMRVMGWVRVRAAKGILNSELSTSCKLAPAGVDLQQLNVEDIVLLAGNMISSMLGLCYNILEGIFLL